MISRANKIPLSIIERLKWDLGLPQDYEKTLLPEFPDYFQIVGDPSSSKGSEDGRALELVCWSNELATSLLEKKAMKGKLGYEKGMAIAFPMQFSRGFEMDMKLKRWVDEWQKLPYISPYENASHLPPKSDESDKWVVAVLHELLHILVPKKTEEDNILCLGEYLGVRSRFRRALLHHPGIFYSSSKIGTYTVVLREGYKRGLLVEDHPWMIIRNRYIHLMNVVKDDHKPISTPGGSSQKKKGADRDGKGKGEEKEEDESGEEKEEAFYESSDAEVVDVSDQEYEEYKNESHKGVQKEVVDNRGRKARKMNFDGKRPSRKSESERAGGKQASKMKEYVPSKVSKRAKIHSRSNVRGSSQARSSLPRSKESSLPEKRTST